MKQKGANGKSRDQRFSVGLRERWIFGHRPQSFGDIGVILDFSHTLTILL